MATNDKYITVAEYARIKQVSPASVYKRLNTSLKNYVKEIDGKKYLPADLLEEEGYQPPLSTVDTPLSTQDIPDQEQGHQADAILEALKALQKQLDEKDKQIERLQQEASELRQEAQEKDRYIQEQGRRLSDLLEQAQALQQNNQVLIAQARAEKQLPPSDQAEGQPEPAQEPARPEPIQEEPKKKKSILAWIFGG